MGGIWRLAWKPATSYAFKSSIPCFSKVHIHVGEMTIDFLHPISSKKLPKNQRPKRQEAKTSKKKYNTHDITQQSELGPTMNKNNAKKRLMDLHQFILPNNFSGFSPNTSRSATVKHSHQNWDWRHCCWQLFLKSVGQLNLSLLSINTQACTIPAVPVTNVSQVFCSLYLSLLCVPWSSGKWQFFSSQ